MVAANEKRHGCTVAFLILNGDPVRLVGRSRCQEQPLTKDSRETYVIGSRVGSGKINRRDLPSSGGSACCSRIGCTEIEIVGRSRCDAVRTLIHISKRVISICICGGGTIDGGTGIRGGSSQRNRNT